MAELDEKTAKAVLKQIEFYFSDSNYSRDKFLRGKASENEEGFVGLDMLTTFKRLQALTEDTAAIAKILEQSSVVELSDDKTMVRRAKPLPEDLCIDSRSIYVKGWDVEKYGSIDAIQNYFEEKDYKVLSIRLRRTFPGKDFKGSAFIEFESSEIAEQVAKSGLKLDEKELEVHMKPKFLEMKKKEKEDRKKEKAEKMAAKKEEEAVAEPVFQEGLILMLNNVGAECTRELLKEVFAECGTIEYVDFQRGDADAMMRFSVQEEVKAALELITEKKTEVAGIVPDASILEGKDEVDYWNKVTAMQKELKKRKRGGGFRGRGRGGGWKRKRGQGGEERPKKIEKV